MQSVIDAHHRLSSVLEQFIRVLRGLSTAGDLSFAAAATLARVCGSGPQRLTDLARAEALSQPGMTQLVTRLERDGLVRRTHSERDGRVVLIEATDAGHALLQLRRSQRAAALGTLLDRLEAADRDAVLAALPALGRLAALASAPA